MSAGLNGLPEDGVAAAARVARQLALLTYQVNIRWGIGSACASGPAAQMCDMMPMVSGTGGLI